MTFWNGYRGGVWWRWAVGLWCGLVWLCLPTQSHAICGLDAAAFDQVRDVEDLDVRQYWARQIARQGARGPDARTGRGVRRDGRVSAVDPGLGG